MTDNRYSLLVQIIPTSSFVYTKKGRCYYVSIIPAAKEYYQTEANVNRAEKEKDKIILHYE